jgi:transposase InsO family protein
MSCRSDHQRKRSAQNGSREHLFQHDDFPLYLAPHSPHHRIAGEPRPIRRLRVAGHFRALAPDLRLMILSDGESRKKIISAPLSPSEHPGADTEMPSAALRRPFNRVQSGRWLVRGSSDTGWVNRDHQRAPQHSRHASGWSESELYLTVEDIDHSRTKTKSPQTNGICERFHKTALKEFCRVAFRKKVYRSIDELLALWIREYSEQRPHQGRWCFGKTPMQTFLDAMPMTKEKMIAADAGPKNVIRHWISPVISAPPSMLR